MNNKKIIWIIILAMVIIGIILILSLKANKSNVKEITPKINYEPEPNFYNEHPKGNQFSVGITGEEMNLLSLEENALIWGVNPEEFVSEFNSKFNTNANLESKLGDVLPNYKNSNRDVKILLDNLK
jgi:hypothetical protein